MFNSAVRKLTLWYLGALFVVCILFTSITYTVASRRLEGGARRQAAVNERRPRQRNSLPPPLSPIQKEQLDIDRRQLRNNLIFIDLVLLSAGSYLSYPFALFLLVRQALR